MHHAAHLHGAAAVGLGLVTGLIGHEIAEGVIKYGFGVEHKTNLESGMQMIGEVGGGIGGGTIAGPLGAGVGVAVGGIVGFEAAKVIEQTPLAGPANAMADGVAGAVDSAVDHVEKGFEGIKDGVVGVFAGDHRHDAATPTGISAAAPPVDLHAGAAGAVLAGGVHKKKHHYKNHKKMHAHDHGAAALPPLARRDSRPSARSEIIVTPLPPPAQQGERVSAAATDASKQRFAPAPACPVTPGA